MGEGARYALRGSKSYGEHGKHGVQGGRKGFPEAAPCSLFCKVTFPTRTLLLDDKNGNFGVVEYRVTDTAEQ